MSAENVETFERALAARLRGDHAAILAEMHPDVELHPGMAAQLSGRKVVHRGHDGVRAWLADLDDSFAELPAEFSDMRDLGERVLALGRVSGRGRESGAAVEWPLAYVIDFDRGKMIRIWTFLDHRDALEAAGLKE